MNTFFIYIFYSFSIVDKCEDHSHLCHARFNQSYSRIQKLKKVEGEGIKYKPYKIDIFVFNVSTEGDGLQTLHPSKIY